MDKNDEEFLKLVKLIEESDGDCPEDLVKLAKTPFEKTVCVEFFKLYEELKTFKVKTATDSKWMRWLVTGVFSVTVITLLFQLIKVFVIGM